MGKFRRFITVATAALAASGLAVVGTTQQAVAAGAPIKIGLVTTNSGPLAAQFLGVASDFKARIAEQNALVVRR